MQIFGVDADPHTTGLALVEGDPDDAVATFVVRDWICHELPRNPKSKTGLKLEPHDVIPKIHDDFKWLVNSWKEHGAEGAEPVVAIEGKYIGRAPRKGFLLDLGYFWMLYYLVHRWTEGRVIQVAPISHKTYVWREVGIRLHEYHPKKGGCAKSDTMELVDKLFEANLAHLPPTHPAATRKEEWAHAKRQEDKYNHIADACAVGMYALGNTEKFRELG